MKVILLLLVLSLSSCKTVNITVNSYPASGSVEIKADIAGSDVGIEGRLK